MTDQHFGIFLSYLFQLFIFTSCALWLYPLIWSFSLFIRNLSRAYGRPDNGQKE